MHTTTFLYIVVGGSTRLVCDGGWRLAIIGVYPCPVDTMEVTRDTRGAPLDLGDRNLPPGTRLGGISSSYY